MIEYVTATPPAGLRPLSFALYDQLLALASEIVSRGMASDAINFRLDDSKLSILESGRLGQSREESYYSGQQAFLDVVVPSQVRGAARDYARAWDDNPVERPGFADLLDIACKDEFGLTMTEIIDLHTALAAIAWQLTEGAPAAMPRVALESELIRMLGWGAAQVAAAVDLLALGPRAEFLRPPAPFKGYDAYPWRFNRALSYLRRPLLLRDGGREVVWGMRHVDLSGQNLLNLVLGERYRATTPALKKLMTELRQDETKAFNDHIAELHEQSGLVVRRNVSSIAGMKIERRRGEPLGDVDVLAADSERRVLHLVECKDLEGARTPAELSNEVEKTFGTGLTKPSAAEKHAERTAWVQHHLADTLEWLGVEDDPDAWTVAAWMVVDTPVMSPYVTQCPLPVETAADMAARLAT